MNSSGNINEVIKTVLNFFIQKLHNHLKAPKALKSTKSIKSTKSTKKH